MQSVKSTYRQGSSIKFQLPEKIVFPLSSCNVDVHMSKSMQGPHSGPFLQGSRELYDYDLRRKWRILLAEIQICFSWLTAELTCLEVVRAELLSPPPSLCTAKSSWKCILPAAGSVCQSNPSCSNRGDREKLFKASSEAQQGTPALSFVMSSLSGQARTVINLSDRMAKRPRAKVLRYDPHTSRLISCQRILGRTCSARVCCKPREKVLTLGLRSVAVACTALMWTSLPCYLGLLPSSAS